MNRTGQKTGRGVLDGKTPQIGKFATYTYRGYKINILHPNYGFNSVIFPPGNFIGQCVIIGGYSLDSCLKATEERINHLLGTEDKCQKCNCKFPANEITKNRGYCNHCLHEQMKVWKNDKEYV